MERILIGIDRDGTMLDDRGLFPGSADYPKEEFKLIEGVLEGLKILRGIPADIRLVMVTNQSGPARRKFDATLIPALNSHINNELLGKNGVKLDDIYYCEHVPQSYFEKTKKKYGPDVPFNKEFIAECRDYKPRTGMIEKATKHFWNVSPEQCLIYVIGDRVDADVELARRVNGIGVFVPSDVKDHSVLDEAHAFQKEYPGSIYVAKNFVDGAKWICKDIAARQQKNGSA